MLIACSLFDCPQLLTLFQMSVTNWCALSLFSRSASDVNQNRHLLRRAIQRPLRKESRNVASHSLDGRRVDLSSNNVRFSRGGGRNWFRNRTKAASNLESFPNGPRYLSICTVIKESTFVQQGKTASCYLAISNDLARQAHLSPLAVAPALVAKSISLSFHKLMGSS